MPDEENVVEDREFRAGAYSGLFAVIMVVALAFMAMTALDTQPMPQHYAQLEASDQATADRTAGLLGLDQQ